MKFKKAGVKIKKYDFRYHQYWWYSRYSEVYKVKETNPKIKINKHHPSQDKTTLQYQMYTAAVVIHCNPLDFVNKFLPERILTSKIVVSAIH